MPNSLAAKRRHQVRVTTPRGEILNATFGDVCPVLGDLYFTLIAEKDITVRFAGDQTVWRYQVIDGGR